MGLMEGDLAGCHWQARRRCRWRQSAPALLFSFLLGACGALPGGEPAAVSPPAYLGSVAAGEPNAAFAAHDSLRAGGSAVDAAAALAMTLAVTRPSRAGLWAGGVCLVNDSEAGEPQAYAFLHPAGAQGEAPPPPLVRGLALMHAAHGRLRWSAAPAAAERLALFGHRVSRAFAQDIEAAPERAATVLAGRTVREGDLLTQPDLARTLGRIRLEGPGALYSGALAAALARGAAAAGYRLDEAALADALPSRRAPLSAEGGSWRAYFAPGEAGAGPAQAALWPRLAEDGRFAGGELPLLPPPPGGGTGFAVVDADGLAVACGLTMNAPFGAGRVAAGAGLAIAAPRPAGQAGPALSPLLATPASGDDIRLAGAALAEGDRLGFVAAIRCRETPRSASEAACTAHADPRGAGLAIQVFDE